VTGPIALDDNPVRDQFVRAVKDTNLPHHEIARRSGVGLVTIKRLLNQEHSGHLDTWFRILNACGIQVGTRMESDVIIKRVNKYTIEVNGHLIRADERQENIIRGMSLEQVNNFLSAMGKK
jgi:hypothetical protein